MASPKNSFYLKGCDTIASFPPITPSFPKVGVACQPGDNADREAAELVKINMPVDW